MRHRGRLPFGVSRSIPPGRRVHRGNTDLLVRDVGAAQGLYDRTFCYYAASYPRSAEVIAKMQGKRIGLALSSEETFPMVSGGIISQMQEFARTHVHASASCTADGNARGDVVKGPVRADQGGGALRPRVFTRHTSDYQIDSVRPGRVWG